jgi:hypothetical protein
MMAALVTLARVALLLALVTVIPFYLAIWTGHVLLSVAAPVCVAVVLVSIWQQQRKGKQ